MTRDFSTNAKKFHILLFDYFFLFHPGVKHFHPGGKGRKNQKEE
jgi:hypothetical protein